jgi:hypothetical protein
MKIILEGIMVLDALDPELSINPSALQVAEFLRFSPENGFCFINIHEYHDIANYLPDHPEHGGKASGFVAYQRYLQTVQSLLPQVPGVRIFAVPVEFIMAGTGLGALPGYAEAAIHREAALKNVLTLTIKGDLTSC